MNSRRMVLTMVWIAVILLTSCSVRTEEERLELMEPPLLWSFSPSVSEPQTGNLLIKTDTSPFTRVAEDVMRSSLRFAKESPGVLYLDSNDGLWYASNAQVPLLLDDHVAWREYQFSGDEFAICYMKQSGQLFRIEAKYMEPSAPFKIADHVQQFYCAESHNRVYYTTQANELYMWDATGVVRVAQHVQSYQVSAGGHSVVYTDENSILNVWHTVGGRQMLFEHPINTFYLSDTNGNVMFRTTSEVEHAYHLYAAQLHSSEQASAERLASDVIQEHITLNGKGIYVLKADRTLHYISLETDQSAALVARKVRTFKMWKDENVLVESLNDQLFSWSPADEMLTQIANQVYKSVILPSNEIAWLDKQAIPYIRTFKGEVEQIQSQIIQETPDPAAWFMLTDTDRMQLYLSSEQSYSFQIPAHISDILTSNQTIYRRAVDLESVVGRWSSLESNVVLNLLKRGQDLGTLRYEMDEEMEQIGFEVLYADANELHLLVKDRPGHIVELHVTGDFLKLIDGDTTTSWFRSFP